MKKGSGHLKPKRPLASIVFSVQGKVRHNVEVPPRTQKDLELAVGKKFIGAMIHFQGITLEGIEPVEAEGDLVVRTEDGIFVTLQIAEVVDQMMRRINEQRNSYAALLLSEYPDVVGVFTGCRLTIVDNGSEPFLPHASSKKGRRNLQDLVYKMEELGDSLPTLRIGKMRVRKWLLNPSGVELSVICERIAESNAGLPPQVSWTGGYVVEAGYRRTLIAKVVKDKIKQGYSKPSGEFWLLMYSSDIIPQPDDPEVLEASAILENNDHPFDQAWFIFPYPNQDLGHLVKLWPR
jgi:hypothetical protein